MTFLFDVTIASNRTLGNLMFDSNRFWKCQLYLWKSSMEYYLADHFKPGSVCLRLCHYCLFMLLWDYSWNITNQFSFTAGIFLLFGWGTNYLSLNSHMKMKGLSPLNSYSLFNSTQVYAFSTLSLLSELQMHQFMWST